MDINGPIERDIPPPSKTGRRRRYKIEDLAVGDSRKFEADPQVVRSSIWPRAKKLGIQLETEAEGSGIRVWRVA